ncbi:MAG: hypothetical protein LAT75_04150 [Candidatus Cyclonatronum sp.]|uniref:ribosome maturation factor RimM n=1 Tax=Cyclonatronum sp. TaxID=3024185 RepID=UPI0025C032D5|nr:hypothetical protein [Cyclonatronum sp.]MCC5932648.1 hypothetical protein [Balneolales bacterium]MCH8486032.1 hypothetical protein [Cyclonatronum sp.]
MYPIGFIKKAHGIKGEIVFVHEEGAPPEVNDLLYVKSSRGDYEPIRIEAIRPNGKAGSGLFFVLFSGISNRSEAETLQDLVLFSPTEPLQRTDQNEEDESALIFGCEGYQLEDEASGISGYITGVMDNPAHPIFEVQLRAQLLLVPAVEAYIAEIDHDAQVVYAQGLDAFFGLED